MSSGDCYDKAVDLLARRPHFRRALEQKLYARDFATEEVEAACVRLAELGLLDDLANARSMVEGAWRRRGYGRVRMRAELEQRGVESRIVEEVLSEISGSEVDRAEEAARRWLRSSSKGRDALARHLGRKGYSGETVYEVLKRLGRDIE